MKTIKVLVIAALSLTLPVYGSVTHAAVTDTHHLIEEEAADATEQSSDWTGIVGGGANLVEPSNPEVLNESIVVPTDALVEQTMEQTMDETLNTDALQTILEDEMFPEGAGDSNEQEGAGFWTTSKKITAGVITIGLIVGLIVLLVGASGGGGGGGSSGGGGRVLNSIVPDPDPDPLPIPGPAPLHNPEPSTVLLMGLGLLVPFLRKRFS